MIRLHVPVNQYQCETPDDVRDLLDKVPTNGPTLHPDVRSDDPRKTWNGWNHTQAHGTDANGAAVIVERWHFASGHDDLSVSVRPGKSLLSKAHALDLIAYPVILTWPQSIVLHPEHTPKEQ